MKGWLAFGPVLAVLLTVLVGTGIFAGVRTVARDVRERTSHDIEQMCAERWELHRREQACRDRGGDRLMGPAMSCYRMELVP